MAAKVLIITGKLVEREELSDIFRDTYEVVCASSGEEGRKLLSENTADIECVFLRSDLPGIPGSALLKEAYASGLTRKIPFIVIEGEDDPDTPDEWFEMGAMDFARRPFRSKQVRRRVQNLVRIARREEKSSEKLGAQDETLKKQFRLLTLQSEELKKSRNSLLEALGSIVEYRNLDYSDHIERVKNFTRILGMRIMQDYPDLGLTKEKVEIYATASMLHDIGKICLPDNIILKPGRLTPEEAEIMKSHTSKGCEMLDGIKAYISKEYLNAAYDICKYHHEKYDGHGYPEGVSGDAIPLSAQIVSVADIYDGLVSERIYKKAKPKSRAFEMITTGECGVFAPKVMESFRRCRAEFEALVDQTGMDLAEDD
ncbi:MAG: HD domain-containing protein [Lachnospiraceae bacterium]|nr:HD domain-containing protein [Lachnospiraceae bacterium]